MSLIQFPRQFIVDINGTPRVGAQAFFYQPTTSTDIATWKDAAFSQPHSQPVESVSSGIFPAIYIDPAVNPTFKILVLDANDALVYSDDNVPALALTAGNISDLLLAAGGLSSIVIKYDRTDAETAAGVTPIDYSKFPYPVKDISRHVSDNTGAVDVTTQMNNALKAEKNILIPEGIYKITGSLIFQDDTNIEGAGHLSTIIKGDLSSKSFFRSTYGESPSVGQRTTGVRIAHLGLFPVTAATITSGSIGVNFRNAQLCTLDHVLMQYVDTGFATDQFAQYNNYQRVIVQVANTGAYLESIGGGNKLVACDIAGNIVALDMNGGAYDILGGTYEALQTTTTYCIHAGRAAGQATYFTATGVYLEGTNAGIIPLQAENSVIGSYCSATLHSTLGAIVNNAGEELELHIRGYSTPVAHALRVAFASTIGGSELASIRSTAGNSLEARNAANNDYAAWLAGTLAAGAAATGTVGFTTFGNGSSGTIGGAGGASALPATPLGYIIAYVGTSQVKIPYYNP